MNILKISAFLTALHLCYSGVLEENDMVKYLSKNNALQGKAEIIFLLDRSGSVGAAHFEEEKGFVESFLTHIVVDVNASRVAVISYSDSVERHIDFLKSPKTKCALSEEMQYVEFKDSKATNTAAALNEAYEVLKNARPDTNKVVVLISDGLATRGRNPVKYAERLKDSGVEIFCFGIGRYLEKELLKLATSPQHVYSCLEFREFKRLARKIRGDPHEISWASETTPNCDYLCDSPYRGEAIDPGCCDHHAKCSCALLSGIHTCICGPGYYGLSGRMGECRACPIGTYKSKLEPTRSCTQCPFGSTTAKLASTRISDCVCKEGYRGDPSNGVECELITCPPLQPPTHGFILGTCRNTFGSDCHFMCEEGYELVDRNSDIRTCRSDGTWSSKTPYCSVSLCPPLPSLSYGRKNCKASTNLTSGTKCTFSCFDGFFLHGSKERECLPSKTWSGTPVVCKPIECNTPPQILNGIIHNCKAHEKPTFHQTCVYVCNKGFKLIGPEHLICRENGRLLDENKKETKPFCKDVTPPELKCPSPIEVSALKGRNGTTVSWTIQFPTDNSGIVPKLLMKPIGIFSSSYFAIGEHVVEYTALDSSNLTSSCELKITIIDKEPPAVLYCPSDIQVSSHGIEAIVTWNEPKFEDNSGEIKTIEKSASSGDTFNVGRHTVSYKAMDRSGNSASCIFEFVVTRTTCPYYPPPANGAFTCHHYLYGRICRAYCNIKHEFVETPAKWYVCSPESQWKTIPANYSIPWPDCARPTIPSEVRLMLEGFYYNGRCKDEDVQRQIKKMFLRQLSELEETQMCAEKGTCSFKTVKVKCGKQVDSVLPIRRKRDVWEYAEKEELEIEFEITINAANQLNDTEEVLQNFFETIQNLKWELDEDFSGPTTTLDPSVNSDFPFQNGSLTGKLVLTQKKTQLECQPGSVLNDHACVACAPGTSYESSTKECWDCPLGEYQDLEGQVECKKCQNGMSTLNRRSRNQTDCKSICLPGTYSPSGLETCMACPIGMYQEYVGQKTCLPCPEEKMTASVQSISVSDCKELCEPGYFSESGLVPCSPCFEGFYQPLQGQTKCMECPSSLSTISKGARNQSECLDLEPCSAENACLNNGECKHVGRSSECVCQNGFEGVRCKKDVNECEHDVCFNGGICVNVEGSFYCNCTNGYTGVNCEEEIDECESSPCLNGGTCLDKINQYECLCTKDFEGVNCELKLDVCFQDVMCLNGGTCQPDVNKNGSFCDCDEGYTGIDCSIDINECLNITCHNNGSCIDGKASYSCLCAHGFTGSFCKENIDDCESNQCSSGSTCLDLIGAYKCICSPGYSGKFCNIKGDDDFILSFPESTATIANMAKMTLNTPLSDVTVSMWVQTSDTDHSGTPLSYAVATTSSLDGTGNSIDNALTISDCSGIQVYVNNEPLVTDVQVADGQWHHLAFTWSSENSGKWFLYKDGELQTQGETTQGNGSIREGGMMIIGQEQDEVGGGFSPKETFTGNITRVNVWNTSFSKNNITRLCSMDDDIPGKVVAWPDFLLGLKGDVNIIRNKKPQ